jgi:hypothetical protein
MKGDTLSRVTLGLGVLLGVGYIVAGIVGWIADVSDGDGSDLVFWLVFLCGGGLVLLAGLFRVTAPRWLSVLLVAIGAVAGALALVWTVIVPILALILIGLVVFRARTPAAA